MTEPAEREYVLLISQADNNREDEELWFFCMRLLTHIYFWKQIILIQFRIKPFLSFLLPERDSDGAQSAAVCGKIPLSLYLRSKKPQHISTWCYHQSECLAQMEKINEYQVPSTFLWTRYDWSSSLDFIPLQSAETKAFPASALQWGVIGSDSVTLQSCFETFVFPNILLLFR